MDNNIQDNAKLERLIKMSVEKQKGIILYGSNVVERTKSIVMSIAKKRGLQYTENINDLNIPTDKQKLLLLNDVHLVPKK